MADVPAGAQYSEDRRWWWDGTAWQPVGESGAPAQPAVAPAVAQPQAAQPMSVTLSDVTVVTAAEAGTTGASLAFFVWNAGAAPIPAGALRAFAYAISDTGAQQSADVGVELTGSIAPGAWSEQKAIGIQLDPGRWTGKVLVQDHEATILAESADVPIEIAGVRHDAVAFDDTRTYSLAVEIQSVEHLTGTAYRVHYAVTNGGDADVPAGLEVAGAAHNERSRSDQHYRFTQPIGAHRTENRFLTLEMYQDTGATFTVTIDVAPRGPSRVDDSVTVTLDAQGQATISRTGDAAPTVTPAATPLQPGVVTLSDVDVWTGVIDGSTAARLSFYVFNTGSTPIPAGAVRLFVSTKSDGSAEEWADRGGETSAEIAATSWSDRQSLALQLDPGHWVAQLLVIETSTNTALAKSPVLQIDIAGEHHAATAFDDSVLYPLAVEIKSLEHAAGAGYRVHYTITYTSPAGGPAHVPPGLSVEGVLKGDHGGSDQLYHFTEPLRAGVPEARYLTLETSGDKPAQYIATITADPQGRSEASHSAAVDVDAEGNATIVG